MMYEGSSIKRNLIEPDGWLCEVGEEGSRTLGVPTQKGACIQR